MQGGERGNGWIGRSSTRLATNAASPRNSARDGRDNEAVKGIEADYNRTSDTHLILHRFLSGPNIRLYFKDDPAIQREA